MGADVDAPVVDWPVEVARAAREENGRGLKGITTSIDDGCCIPEGAYVLLLLAAAHMATAWSSMARR